MKRILILLIGPLSLTTFGQTMPTSPTGSLGILQQHRSGIMFDSIVRLPVRDHAPYATNIDSLGRIQVNADTKDLEYHNGEEFVGLATENYNSSVNEGRYNTSFVDVLHNSSSIQSSYIIKKQDGDLDGFGLGYLVNGEAVQIDFYQDIDGFTRLYNVFSNTIDGDIMLLSGANRLSSGVLEFAVRGKKSGSATAYNWIPNHTIATAGALTGIDTKIYIDGILTDVYALVNDTHFVINDFVMIQKAIGYNLADSINPLFSVVTTHKFKDGKLTITNNLTALDDLTMYDGYSGKITGYDPLVNKIKLDDETVITPTGSNAYTLYNAPIKSAVYYNSAGKYALAITCGSVSESTSNNKAYSAAPAKLLHWDRWPNNSIYFLWTPRDIEVEVPLGAKFTSTNEIFVTTNVEDIINP